jgi:hypothetical protein
MWAGPHQKSNENGIEIGRGLELGFFYPDIEIQDSFSKDFLLFNSR